MSEGCGSRYYSGTMIRRFMLVLVLLLASCTPLMQGPTGDNATAPQGKTDTPPDTGTRPAPLEQEQADYDAAYQFVRSGNPNRDYDRAAKEFEGYLATYPGGAHADEASSWLALIHNAQQAGKREQELGSLKKSLEDIELRLRSTEAAREAAAGERDALIEEKTEVQGRIDGLEREKAELRREKSTVVKARDDLAADKTALEKKINSLTKEKERLTAAKINLQKRLRELSELDVRMEKKRKKTE
jgi:hypothetical protein